MLASSDQLCWTRPGGPRAGAVSTGRAVDGGCGGSEAFSASRDDLASGPRWLRESEPRDGLCGRRGAADRTAYEIDFAARREPDRLLGRAPPPASRGSSSETTLSSRGGRGRGAAGGRELAWLFTWVDPSLMAMNKARTRWIRESEHRLNEGTHSYFQTTPAAGGIRADVKRQGR